MLLNIHPSYLGFKAFQISSCLTYRRIEWHFPICHQIRHTDRIPHISCCYCCCTQTLLLVDLLTRTGTGQLQNRYKIILNSKTILCHSLIFRFSFLYGIFQCILLFHVFFLGFWTDWSRVVCFIFHPPSALVSNIFKFITFSFIQINF